GSYCLCNIIYALFQTRFIIYFIDALKDGQVTREHIIRYVAIAGTMYALGLFLEEFTTAFANSRVIKMTV
ncbi:MAG: hypothetical protein IJ961_07235, partial [Bacteroidales bacterium]|nr:hypothetical protein [Bacteroidales bacterium]